MSIFKVGDKCRYVNQGFDELTGEECEVIAGSCVKGETLFGKAVLETADYVIRFNSGYECLALRHHLEPLNKPKQQETIAWEEACFDRDGKFRIGVAA